MNRFLALIVAIAIAAGGWYVFTERESKNEQPIALAIGVQNTANNTLPDYEAEGITDCIKDAATHNGSVIMTFEIDGNAYKTSRVNVKHQKGESKANKEILAKQCISKTVKAIEEKNVPLSEEVDILYAIKTMTNSLRNADKNSYKKLIFVSDLLSTKGIINFCKSTIYFDINNYIDNYLVKELPDMSDIDEVVFYITEGTGSQVRLQNSDIAKLKIFYGRLCEKAGADNVDFIECSGGTQSDKAADFPKVSPVDIRVTDFTYNVSEDKIDLVLEESMLFVKDSTDFLDEKKAEEDLKKIVDSINNSTSKTLIFGSTATTDSSRDVHLNFAMKRAEKIYKKLVELGADKSKMQCYSLGKEPHPYRINDTGEFKSEENRKQNRCVFVVSENLEKGKELKAVADKYSINR